MNQGAERPSQKRLQILDADEIEALYGRPRFTPEERFQYFTLTLSERDARALLRSVPSQRSFMLHLAYFKAKHIFSLLPLLRSPMMLIICSRTLASPPLRFPSRR